MQKIKRFSVWIVWIVWLVLCLGALLLAGCSFSQENQGEKQPKDSIPFGAEDLYAVAYLGYEEPTDLDFYAETYLGEEVDLPTYYVSGGEYYLIIPRYSDMTVQLYGNDMENLADSKLFLETTDSRPFILQCNISDIFPDVTVSLTYQGETVQFSPFLSLKDGSVQVGDRGVNITRVQQGE